MVFGEFVLFLCLFIPFVVFVFQGRRFIGMRVGYRTLTVGLGLLSLTSLVNFLIIEPYHFLDYAIIDEMATDLWRTYGYLPGLITFMVGLASFLPSIAQLTKETQSREATERKNLGQTADLQSEKIRAEKAERVLVEALESISDAFIIFDIEDRVVAFNSRYRELFSAVDEILKPGVTFEELIRYQASKSELFDNAQRMEEWVQIRLEEHRGPAEPKEQVFENGRIYRLSEFKTVSGGTVALRTDITDLRERENALRHLNERFEEAQTVAHIGNWIRAYDGSFYDWSSETSRIMGYVPSDVDIGRDAYISRVHPQDMERMLSVVDWAAEKGEDYQVDYRLIRPNKQIVHVREIGGIQLDISGNPYLIRGTLQDITAQQLAEAELIDAKMLAEEGAKSKSMFLANMSHELRTPLNAVIGFAEVISKEIFGPIHHEKYKEYSENILSSGQHLLSLINDILDFSRLEAGKYELHEETFNLHDIFSWIDVMLGSKAEEKSISLSFEEHIQEMFLGDERKIKQVLINLVNNAIKFTPEGGDVKVSVKTESENYIAIIVEDNGYGIRASELDHVMRPFGRTNYSTIGSIEGTGLGLPLAKSIVELHDGELRIESKEKKGTIVEIRFPKKRLVTQGRLL